MNRTRLTPDRIRRLACTDGQAFLFDTDMQRLAVRATKGAKAFVFEGYLNRRTVRITIGAVQDWTLDAARKEARRLQTLIDRGVDPREQKAAEREARAARKAAEAAACRAADEARRYTLGALLDAYTGHLRARGKTKSARDAAGAFKRHLPPRLLMQPAKGITSRELAAVVRAVHESGKTRMAGVLRSYLLAAFNAARHAEFDTSLPAELIGFEVTANPAELVKPIPVGRRDRVLSLAELRAYVAHLGDDPTDCALRLALLAGGQRMAQLLRATVNDWDGATLRLTDPKGRRSTPREHLLPLAPLAAELAGRLATRARSRGVPWLFSHGTKPMDPATPGKRVAEISARLNGEPFDLRDIRRTCETLLAGLGVSRDTRAQLLSHGLSGVQAAHYDRHSYTAEKHAALLAWERHLTEAAGENVVPLRRGA
nr:tyrosine recombinase [uncultured bacterium]BAH89887.1 tyrosine recombinase [uncultured bacterium]BAH90146.1 tyrosine recombinase [uncultured bacterium]